MKKVYLLSSFLALSLYGKSQMTIQSGATLYIESGAKVTLQGDLTSSANIQGTGTILMKGTGLQNINMNGNLIPNLEIDNAANVTLAGSAARIGTSLLFTNGKLLTAAQDLYIASAATITGQNSNRFIWTDGTGQVRKELTADISNYEIPVGFNADYRPVYLTSTGGSYSNANFGVRCASGASANKPPMMANYLSAYWPVTKTGITGGTQTLSGQYSDPTDVSGDETKLAGYFFNGTDWSSVNENHDVATNRVSMPITAGTGELTGMNKFIAVGSRAFLQGAYTNPTVAGLMNDGLRSGSNVIPTSDPYRTPTYSGAFTHVANPNTEMVSGTVFNKQPLDNDDIVDWVFLELRDNASPGNTVLQTRSALIQRDGDIVDVDGTSPVTFNNVVNGLYTLAVRHRNHLGISTAPASPRTFAETKSIAFTTNITDLRSPATPLFGTGANYTTASHPVMGTVNVLWGGNASMNNRTNYTGLGNDKDFMLVTVLGNNPSNTSVSNTYSPADLNMNKAVRYSGLANDKDFLLITTLQNNPSNSRTQAIPN